MLTSLHVKNYVIIDELLLDFKAGMTVVSGETGAGKSIIMDALELAIGARADSAVIKQGQPRCEITAVFEISDNSQARNWLTEHDLETDSVDECMFRRIITEDGRSRSSINGQLFPLQKMRELAQYLLDVHGQHEHQSLLKSETHRQQLDDYSSQIDPNHGYLLREVHQHYRAWQVLSVELKRLSLESQSSSDATGKNLLNYQLEELLEANLQEGEVESLNEEHTQLSQVDGWLTDAQAISEIISSEQEASINRLLKTALTLLPHSSTWANLRELLENAQIQCQEAEEEVRHIVDTMEANPERLQEIEQRLQLLNSLARKHHITMDKLPELQQKLTDMLEKLTHCDKQKILLEKQMLDIKKKHGEVSKKLSESRKHHAVTLGGKITELIQTLGMSHGQLMVNVHSVTPSDSELSCMHLDGYDRVEYFIMTNPDQPSRPLNKIASGGELSRISLAIEVITTQHNQSITRLFDEIDVGIGGQTAAVVGRLLRSLGKKSQILCITHQPQTAAQGNQHFCVRKKIIQEEGQKNKTIFTLTELDEQSRIQEIARMLGGLEVTSNTLAHAKDLLMK
jgi:DNA repair protein RecN (Recombination protein N)